VPFISYAPQGSEPTPVFGIQEAQIATEPLVSKQSLIMGIVFIFLAIAGWLALQMIPSGTPAQPQIAKKDQKKPQNRDGNKTQRKVKLSQASAGLLLNPTQSLQTLNELINQDIKDEVGQEASQLLINYYQKNNQTESAGDLLLRLDRPTEAAEQFLKEPRLVSKAETSLFISFKKSQGKESADFLIRDINLLINPIKNFNLAKERIELFEKTFPALTHPFGYYSLPIDQKIQTTFVALSRSFVDDVTRTIKEEFPQINLEGRPVVEVKKDATGNYRVISRYQGDLLLRSDRINNIYFLYWLIDSVWVLVDTNLTKERQAFAATMRKKYETRVTSPSTLLELLEGRYRSQFPDQALHELFNLQKTVKPLKKN
jgi:hypothetical protein